MAKDGLLYVLLLFIVVLGCVAVNVKTGDTHTFKALQKGPFEIVDWKHNGSLVVEWEPPTKPKWFRYEKRAKFNETTGDLSLTVTKEDSGHYKGQFQVAGFLKYFEETIRVFDPLSDVEVTCEKNATDITLTASVDPQVPADITWRILSEKFAGKSIHIKIEKDRPQGIVFCTANNEVSTVSKEFNLEKCPPKGEESESNIGAIVAPITVGVVVAAAVAAAAAAVAIWFRKNKQTSRERQSAPGETNGLTAKPADPPTELQPCMSDATSDNQTAEADNSSS